MEVKIIRQMNYLPKVFITPDLNKFSILRRYVNCSGGCIEVSIKLMTTENADGSVEFKRKIDVEDVRKVKGIYFVPHDPIMSIKYRQRAIRTENDLMEILADITLTKLVPLEHKLLIKYGDYDLTIYDRYFKGKMIEFPILTRQGHLSIYKVPKLKEVYRTEFIEQNGKRIPVEKFDDELLEQLFEKVKEMTIYNHKITFEKEIMLYKGLFVVPGEGALIYVPESMKIKLESQEHGSNEVIAPRDTWLLFSHPRPRNSKD